MTKMSFNEYRSIAQAPKSERMQNDTVYWFGRALSARISYLIACWLPNVSANQISIFNSAIVLVVIASSMLYGLGYDMWLVLGQLVALQVAALGDRVDGEVARYRATFTQAGVYYDRVFHFLFPFGLYISMGAFFAEMAGYEWLLTPTIVLATLASLSNMSDNFRQGIAHKIRAENHGDVIQDVYERPAVGERPPLPLRIGHYAIFLMYDWVWMIYFVLILLTAAYAPVSLYIFVVHGAVSIIVLLYQIFFAYPRKRLFSRTDLL